jgi:hypothetical protein
MRKKTTLPSKFPSRSILRSIAAHAAIFGFFVVFALFSLAFVGHHTAEAALKTRFTVPAYCNRPGVECGWVQLVQLGSEILSFGVYIAILGATVVIVMAGWKIMMNSGNEGEVKTGKKMLWAAITGIIVTMCAYMAVQFILNKLGVIQGIRLFI